VYSGTFSFLLRRTYGSGYPGVTGRGVSGRGFPFYFWPVVWGSAGGAAYLHDDEVIPFEKEFSSS
jgi:hypothetical protein